MDDTSLFLIPTADEDSLLWAVNSRLANVDISITREGARMLAESRSENLA